jgi:transposase-like protein
MSRDVAADLWRQRLAACAQTGMTVRRWCASHGVPVHQYYYWRRRFAVTPAESTATCQWLTVEVVDTDQAPTRPDGITVRIAGAEILLLPGFDPALLRAAVRALAVDPC